MKYINRNPISLLAAAMLAIPLWAGMRQMNPASSKTFTGEVTDTLCAQSGSHDAMMAKMPTMGKDKATCTKKCAEIGAKYALLEDSTKAVYMLDESPQVQASAGQRVRLTGTLEGHKIKVTDINPLA